MAFDPYICFKQLMVLGEAQSNGQAVLICDLCSLC